MAGPIAEQSNPFDHGRGSPGSNPSKCNLCFHVGDGEQMVTTLELHSRAAPSVEAHHRVNGSSKEMGFLNPNFPLFGESGGAI